MDLKGKFALVTGGSRGIGRAISLKLADMGAGIAVNFFSNRTGASEVVEEIKAKGDSYTFGIVQRLEDTFPKVVEQRLNEVSSDVRFRALIHAIPGWGTVNVNRLVFDLESSIQYRMVILGFCVANDVINNLYYKESLVSEPAIPDSLNISRIMDEVGFPFLYRESYLARLIWNRTPIEKFLRYRVMRRNESLQRTRRELDRLLQVVGREKLMVVVIPPPTQVTDSWIEKWIHSERINQTVISWCQEQNVPCLELLDSIKGHRDYYYQVDKHFNPTGNHEIGRIVADFLIEDTKILD